MEDPSEDVFVTLVNSPRGNYRILEGVWEGNGFRLQRVLNVVERMPETAPFAQIRNSVYAMLALSDEIAERAGLRENLLGREMPLDAIPAEIADRLSRYRRLVSFSEEDLAGLKISMDSLREFVFDPDQRPELATQEIGHTELERRPIAVHGGTAHLLLPTAVATAITRFVIESIFSMGEVDTFERALSREFSELFAETPILGAHTGAHLEFRKIPGGRIGALMRHADPGRLLLLIFFVDGLGGFLEAGMNGANPDPDALSEVISGHLRQASVEAEKQVNFLDGVCLLVGCGLGRNIIYAMPDDLPDLWRLEVISAYDLGTLSWLPGFDMLSIWRLLDSVAAIEREGATLLNVNGLLNLIACCKQLDGHLVPHGNLPDGFISPGKEAVIQVPQNALRDLRHEILAEWNPRRILDPDGRWVRVRKIASSEFEEDRVAPLYGSEDDIRNRKLRGVYVAPNRPWWIAITAPADAPADGEFSHWMMLCRWLSRAAPVLDEAYPGLPRGPICFDVGFEEILGAIHDAVKPKDADELRPLIHTTWDANNSKIRIRVDKGFADGLIQPENIAEQILVEALVAGAAAAGGELADTAKCEDLLNRICPNAQARYMHRFQARSFRDMVSSEIKGDPELINPLDDGFMRIGLGWRVQSRETGTEISGVIECTSYLNNLVGDLLDDVCAELKLLDRHSFVRSTLLNHEIAAHDRDVWSRSSQANIAMHEDKDAALSTIVKHQSRLNACFVASRILLEAAICECPPEGGRKPGRLDFSRLMAGVLAAHHYGGWSDAIYWGAMEPRLRITPLGDVHMKPTYINEVYEPFARVGGEVAVREATDSYARLYALDQQRSSFEKVCGSDFLGAWQAEFGVSLDGMRTFVDNVENMGLHPPKVVVEMRLSKLAAVFASSAGVSLADASGVLEGLLSKPRAEWRAVDGEFTNKDWFPWRFRRRLSILRRPLIQVDTKNDPMIILAPGLLRESFAALVSWFHRGEIPPPQARSIPMGKWIGHANNIQRSEFNSKVASRMRELGWESRYEIKLTEILGRSLDRNYGDIDVLAWRPDSNRVLAMECKDVQYLKTLGEVAEQLADFRGEVRADDKPDHLKRHLDRLDRLRANRDSVSKFLRLGPSIEVEGHLVFRNPVPMQFAWDKMARGVG
ncbi:MAG TPA: hypothetical protein VMU77_02515, partial [Acidimicrobiales bacterium]|nr:hypothetical protein [Acidimicrobiales bacterium]